MFPLYDHNPVRSKPLVTRALIFANVVAFLMTWWLERHGVTWMSSAYGMVPSRLSADPEGEVGKIFSSMFLHADFMHLLWNMIFLHIFGDNVEDALGKARYLGFYLLAGAAGAIAQHMIAPLSTVPMVGASGAIAGVLGGYLVLYPRAPVTLLNPVILLWLIMGPLLVLPAWAVVGWWFLGNVTGGLAALGGQATGTAFFAHLGGFIAGLLLIKPLVQELGPAPHKWSGLSEPPRVTRPKIFPKDESGPFWRS
jgi:membrane associated rhomboid family serine protease